MLMLAHPAAAETMASAVVRALATHPEIAAFDFDRLATREGVGVAKSLNRPKVSVSAQAGERARKELSDESYGLSLAATQTIYDGGESRSQIRKSRAESRAADSRYQDAILQIGLMTVQSYIEVQRSSRQITVFKDNLSSLNVIYKRVKLRVDGGIGTQADIYQARARLEAAREQLETAKQQHADAVADFQSLTGEMPGKLETIGAPSKALPRSADEAVNLSRRYSPKIIAAGYDAIAADATRSATESLLAPRLNLRLGLDYDAEVEGIATETRNASAMLSLKFDLYDGGARRSRIAQARYQAEASHQTVLATKRDVELEMRRAWNAIRASVGRTGPLQRRADDARKSLKLNLSRFSAGLVPLDVLLSLQDEAAASEVAFLNETASYRYNVYRVLAATGRLFGALGIDPGAPDRLQ